MIKESQHENKFIKLKNFNRYWEPEKQEIIIMSVSILIQQRSFFGICVLLKTDRLVI